MGFNTQNAIIAQNAATAAATILASLGESGSTADLLAEFDAIRTHIFNGSIMLAGAESAEDVPAGGSGGARRSYGGRSSNGGGNQDPATLVINMGKYKGKTIEAVYKDDSDYLDWLSKNSNNEFLRERVNAFLATVE